jgi:multiple sugar transport system ATP-binding protein
MKGACSKLTGRERLYDLPANRFVAEFIGSPPMNLIPAQLRAEDGRMRLKGTGFALDAPLGFPETTCYLTILTTEE